MDLLRRLARPARQETNLCGDGTGDSACRFPGEDRTMVADVARKGKLFMDHDG